MASDRVGDMTHDELKALIETTVDQRTRGMRQLGGKQSVAEINALVDEHIWTPPLGTPSSLEILLDERKLRANDSPTETKTRGSIIETLIEPAQKILGLLVGFSVILTIGGFWIVNTYLSPLTSIETYLVNPSQILAAGVWFLVFASVAALILIIISYAIFKYLPDVLDLAIFGIKWVATRKKPVWESKKETSIGKFEKIYIVGSLIVLLIFSLPNSFVLNIYKGIPHAWGGGSPVPVILIFRDSTMTSLLDLTPEATNQTQRTRPLVLLAELVNGVLVYDPWTEHTVAVSNDDLLGRLEEKIVPLSQLPFQISIATDTP